MDLLICSLEPKLLSRMHEFILQKICRDLGDLSEFTTVDIRSLIHDIRLHSMKIAESVYLIGRSKRGDCKTETTIRQDLKARNSMSGG